MIASNAMRLLGSPVIAAVICWGLGLSGVAAQVVIICAASPSAVNSVLLAIEYKSDPVFASQTVFLSTLLSILTMPVVIAMVQLM